MDQFKVFLGYAQKYHFWILCVIAMVAGIVGWMMASGKLSEQYASNKGSVTSKFQTLQGIQSNQFPPNDEWTKSISSLTDRQRDEVKATWESVYEAQRQVLSWPEVMPEDFKQRIQTLPADAEFLQTWIRVYQNEVLRHEFPKLAEIVGAAPLDPASQPKPPEGTPPPVYKVTWERQDEIRKALEEGMTSGMPSTLQVRLRQEDYWVYQALLNIIRKTNEGAQYTSRVKVIEDLAIGANTAQQFEKGMGSGHIKRLVSAGEDLGGMAPPVDMSGDGQGMEPSPDEGRYMDAEGKVLGAGMWKDQQFKRLPVYLKLVMDQREITRLLTECANYPLPVEVRQLRINPGGVGPGGSAQKRDQKGAAPPAPSGPSDAYNVVVEIHGIIYLFNPPDPAKLGAGTEIQSAG